MWHIGILYAIFVALLSVIIVVTTFRYFNLYVPWCSEKKNNVNENFKNIKVVEKTQINNVDKTQNARKRKKDKRECSAWELVTLKGHNASVLDLDFNSSGKYLLSIDKDGTVFIWNMKNIERRERKQCNLTNGSGDKIQWSPDNRAFMVQNKLNGQLHIYRLKKKPESLFHNPEFAFSITNQKYSLLVGAGIACSGRFMMTCTEEGALIIWNLKGLKLTEIMTGNEQCSQAVISPCGRFIAVSVNHQNCVPILLHSINIDMHENAHTLLSVSPNGKVLAVGFDFKIYFYSMTSGILISTLQDVHSEPLTQIIFDPLSNIFVTSGDKNIRVFGNVPGLHVVIKELKQELSKVGMSSKKDRILQLLQTAHNNLQAIESKSILVK